MSIEIKQNGRGFEYLASNGHAVGIQQSSAIGDYEDAYNKPGSSFLWVDGEHLSREQVQERLENDGFPAEYKSYIQNWLKTGSFNEPH